MKAEPDRPRRRLRVPGALFSRLLRGPAGDPVWARPALLLLLAVTAGLYLWDLGASGWANSFYSAAVQAGTKSWKAFFFGSSDSSNFITVDKPPAALWVMEISARIFGLSSWSILVPQALEGVAAVAVLYATVRRWASAGAGLVAATVMAFTPVAALMFRFNNPDALLVLLLCGAAFAHDAGHRKILYPLARFCLCTGGAGVYHEDDAGLPGRPRNGHSLLLGCSRSTGPAGAPTGGRRHGHAGVGRVVGGGGRAHAGGRPSVCGRVARQQHPQPHFWLQRFWPPYRQRIGQRGGWRRPGHRRPMGPHRADAAVRDGNGQPESPGCYPPR